MLRVAHAALQLALLEGLRMDCGRARAARSCCNLHKLRQPCGLQRGVSRWILATSTGFCNKKGHGFFKFLDGRKQSSSGRFPAVDVSWSVGESPWLSKPPSSHAHSAGLKALLRPSVASQAHRLGRARPSDQKPRRVEGQQSRAREAQPASSLPEPPCQTAAAPRARAQAPRAT